MSDEAIWEELTSGFGDMEPDLADALASVDDSTFIDWMNEPHVATSHQFSVPADSTDSTEDDVTTGQQKSGSIKSWTSRREEVAYLRKSVQELEAELAHLRDPAGLYRYGTNELDKLWASVAARQVHALDRSSRENARLRVMIARQLRVIHSMKRIVTRKAPNKIPTWDTVHPGRLCHAASLLDDPRIELKMYQDVNNMIGEFDSIFNHRRFLEHQDKEFHATELTINSENRPIIETRETRLFPFDHHTTANTLWDLWATPSKNSRGRLSRNLVNATDDTMCRVAEGEFDWRGATGKFRAKMIARQVRLGDCDLMPAMLIIEPLQVDEKPIEGVYLLVRAWNTVEAASTGDASITPLARRRYYSVYASQAADHSDSDAANVIHHVTRFVLKNSGLRLKLSNQALENRLLASSSQVKI